MWTYWLLFFIPAVVAVGERPQIRAGTARNREFQPWPMGWILVNALVAFLVGWRVEVGGDWLNYFAYLDGLAFLPFLNVFTMPDPGYQLLNWISLQMDWGVIGVNALGGIIFATGVAVFCRSLARPWLALTVAVPYLIIVVGMGYTRQAIATSLAMIGIVALQRKATVWFVVWVLLGTTFHKTAVLLLPIGALASTSRRPLQILWVSIAFVSAYVLFLADSAEVLYSNYVEAESQSEGALVRIMMNAVAALILMFNWTKFRDRAGTAPLWRWVSWGALVLAGALVVSPASTAIDRLALYMLPLQLVVFSSAPTAMSTDTGKARGWVGMTIAYYLLVLFVWLNYATHAPYWLPYKSYLFELLS